MLGKTHQAGRKANQKVYCKCGFWSRERMTVSKKNAKNLSCESSGGKIHKKSFFPTHESQRLENKTLFMPAGTLQVIINSPVNVSNLKKKKTCFDTKRYHPLNLYILLKKNLTKLK